MIMIIREKEKEKLTLLEVYSIPLNDQAYSDYCISILYICFYLVIFYEI